MSLLGDTLENKAELSRLMEDRKASYAFFADIFSSEVNASFVEHMRGLEVGEDSDLVRLADSLAEGDVAEVVSDLRCEYAALFLNMSSTPVFPYESVYLSENHLLMQEQRDAVLDDYRLEGLDVAANFTLPEDHIAVELYFMSHLCETASACISRGDEEALASNLEKQELFFKRHLVLWVPDFCSLVQERTRSAFYRDIAHMLKDFLVEEEAALLP